MGFIPIEILAVRKRVLCLGQPVLVCAAGFWPLCGELAA